MLNEISSYMGQLNLGTYGGLIGIVILLWLVNKIASIALKVVLITVPIIFFSYIYSEQARLYIDEKLEYIEHRIG